MAEAMGAMTMTSSSPSGMSRSADAVDAAPPSMNRRPPICTGGNQPGTAHEAQSASASEAGSAPGDPNAIRSPVS
ncbi:MAG: hypothetical protein M3Q98_06315 [Actinomycetota bacterium]|nr:hypothetical protein [Actinomycetota bacterium]